MEKVLLRLRLDLEPETWGTDDARKRKQVRDAIKLQIPGFDEQFVENLISSCNEINVTLNCYLSNPLRKDVDNLAKIPLDAVFFSAQNERGHKENWEAKVTALFVRKIKSANRGLEIILTTSTT